MFLKNTFPSCTNLNVSLKLDTQHCTYKTRAAIKTIFYTQINHQCKACTFGCSLQGLVCLQLAEKCRN